VRECRDIANQGWVDVSGLVAAGRLAARVDNYRPFDSDLWLVLGRDTPGTVRVRMSAGPNAPVLDTRTVRRSDDAALHAALGDAGFDAAGLPDAGIIDIVHVRINDNGDFAVLSFDLGGAIRFGRTRGTTDLKSNPKRLTVCAGDSF
jgi:hypothetical protein